MKSIIAAGALCALSSPAFAGVYANVETNAGFVGSDYTGATTETHIGFEGDLGTDAGWYIQGGPAFVSVDGGETTTEYSGKIGVGVDITESVSAYGEVSAMTQGEGNFDEDLNYGVKVGATYRF